MTIFVYDIFKNATFLTTVGVETEDEREAEHCVRANHPGKTINLVRRMSTLFKVVKNIEDDYFDADFERFNRIQKDYGLKTIWCLYEVKNMEDLSPYAFNKIVLDHLSYADMTMNFNRHTWMEIWEMVDKLVRIHDPAHPYIEKLRVSNNTLFVTTGS